MVLEIMDKISPLIPTIRGPGKPLSLREKLYWTAGILVVYFTLYHTYAYGVNQQQISPAIQLISIIFAAKFGSIITVGITPIVLSSMILQLLSGSGLFNIDMNDPMQKARFQTLQKLFAISLAFIEALLYIVTKSIPVSSASLVPVVILQFALGGIIIIYLDEIMSKYGITSGINMFIASGVSYSIVGGTFGVLLPQAILAFHNGGAAALSGALLAFGPLFFAIVVFLISIYVYGMKVELPLAFEQFRGVGGRLPLPFLYVNVLPVILATSLELSLSLWFKVLAGVSGSFASITKFIAFYQPVAITTASGSTTTLQLSGGVIYLISPIAASPLPQPAGLGGYGPYFTWLATQTSKLFLPWGGFVMVPEWVHVIIYTLVLVLLCIVFGKLWIELAGQGAKDVSKQIGDLGWQIPGFRRDPRIVENVLNKYIPTLTILSSICVGLLAALANLTGAIGTGMGILLTVGIIYMVYQQLEQERIYDSYPLLDKIMNK